MFACIFLMIAVVLYAKKLYLSASFIIFVGRRRVVELCCVFGSVAALLSCTCCLALLLLRLPLWDAAPLIPAHSPSLLLAACPCSLCCFLCAVCTGTGFAFLTAMVLFMTTSIGSSGEPLRLVSFFIRLLSPSGLFAAWVSRLTPVLLLCCADKAGSDQPHQLLGILLRPFSESLS